MHVYRECQSCGRKRSEGWVLVEGLCRACGLDSWRKRSDELLEQAKRLMGEG